MEQCKTSIHAERQAGGVSESKERRQGQAAQHRESEQITLLILGQLDAGVNAQQHRSQCEGTCTGQIQDNIRIRINNYSNGL